MDSVTRKVRYQIRLLEMSPYTDSSPVIFQGDEESAKRVWAEDGYEKSNRESLEPIFGLFKVTYERLDNPWPNMALIEKQEASLAEYLKQQIRDFDISRRLK